MEYLERLEAAISRIVIDCEEATLVRMCFLLKNQFATNLTSAYEWNRLLEPNNIPAPLLFDFIDSWNKSCITFESILLAIATAVKTKKQLLSNDPMIEMVWTGPIPPSSGSIRSTLSVMQEMISSAKKQILLVGYSFTNSTSFPSAVIEQLVQSMMRGCEVRIALHDDGYNFRNLKQSWPRELPLPVILRWGGVPGDEMASLHAKLLLIDQADLLVTSANLTHHGLSSNIEVGIRIRKSKVVKQMSRLFVSLERSGILKRI